MKKLIGNLSQGLVFVLSAPSGTGKTTLVRMLAKEFPCIHESVSFTTRKKRPGEVEGKDYYFITQEEFDKKLKEGDFLEFATVFGYHYGTSKILVDELQKGGKHVFLIIDTQGAMQLKRRGFDAVWIFLTPPSLEELQKRLAGRQTESKEAQAERLSWAKQELERMCHYDYHIECRVLEESYAILRSIVIAEEHRIRNPIC